MKPKPLPADVLRRVIKVAKVNGMVFVFPVSCLCALVALVMGDLLSVFFGLCVAAAGWSEWQGAKLLQRGEARGINWLVRSQVYLMGLILLYALTQMAKYDADYEQSLVSPEMNQLLQQAGTSSQEILPLVRMAFYGMYGTLAVVTVLYQGGLALFYRRRAETVRNALAESARPEAEKT
ncbi:MAG: hypothetical protein ABSE59_00470 [Opitutaceae bacterium]|jgi:hypothetical protein